MPIICHSNIFTHIRTASQNAANNWEIVAKLQIISNIIATFGIFLAKMTYLCIQAELNV